MGVILLSSAYAFKGRIFKDRQAASILKNFHVFIGHFIVCLETKGQYICTNNYVANPDTAHLVALSGYVVYYHLR